MDVTLTDEQANVLRTVLDAALGDLSAEIAGTDNAGFRAALDARRDLLRQVRAELG